MAIDILILVIALAALVAWLVLTFNSLVGARQKVKNSWAQIDVQLKRRAGLVYNLVETVRGYARQEKGIFENVAKMRAGVMSVTAPDEVIAKSNALAAGLRSVFAVAEGYPRKSARR